MRKSLHSDLILPVEVLMPPDGVFYRVWYGHFACTIRHLAGTLGTCLLSSNATDLLQRNVFIASYCTLAGEKQLFDMSPSQECKLRSVTSWRRGPGAMWSKQIQPIIITLLNLTFILHPFFLLSLVPPAATQHYYMIIKAYERVKTSDLLLRIMRNPLKKHLE